jgi:hypothetical protein
MIDKHLYDEKSELEERESLSYLTSFFMNLIVSCSVEHKFKTIDDILDELDTSRMSSLGMIGIARTLFPVRMFLTRYKNYLERVKDRLVELDKDHERIMRGLDK